MDLSPLQKERYQYRPKLPALLKTRKPAEIKAVLGQPTSSYADAGELKKLFKNNFGAPIALFEPGNNPGAAAARNVGVILSGGQAPGGHNVIAGLFDGIKAANASSKLFGFLGGPSGIVDDRPVEITAEMMDAYRNTGGFDMIGSGRTKLETVEQFDKCIEVCRRRGISAVVIIGGDDSNTNAAVLAEYFAEKQTGISVIGCPKTIDGDLKNEYIETSFGFDTATKTYAELIGNIERDADSAKKYWHFIKLMGRSASHIALECALQTQPNFCIISEEVEKEQKTLMQIAKEIADIVITRANDGKTFGVGLIPEGLIEFIPEMKRLIAELNDLMAQNESEFSALPDFTAQTKWLKQHFTKESAAAFDSLPEGIAKQLLLDRDPHGNVQVSLIETEKLLSEMVRKAIKARGEKVKFSALHHFFGYEGRCAFPSNFDADYCYSLGYNASLLIANNLSGYLSSVRNLAAPADEWIPGGIPLTMMMNMEQRHGALKPVIRKALVDLEAAPFRAFASNRERWARETCYTYPGAIQYYGPASVCDLTTRTLACESGKN